MALNSAKHPPTPFLFSIGAMRNLGKIRGWVVLSGGLAALGPIGVYAYIIGFAIPMTWDIPLMVLAVTSILVAVCSDRVGLVVNPPLPAILIALFLLATGLSLVVSDDIGRSLKLSASLLPALLLFFLITEYFRVTRDIRLLYLTCSIVGLGLAIALLWAAWKNPGVHPHAIPHPWVSYVGSPIIITRNDPTFLSVIAPFSLILFYREPRSVVGILAALSVVLSLSTVVVFQSRGATLTLVAAVVCTAVLLRPRLGLAVSFVVFLAALIVDGTSGFPLTERFLSLVDRPLHTRSELWEVAWRMFLDAPLLGHGPHTFVLFHKVPWSHNLYLQVLAEQGIIGLVTLVALLVYGLSTAWKIRSAARDDIRYLSAGACGSMIGFCLSSAIELSLLRQWVIVVLFLLLGVVTKLSSLQVSGEKR
jgi:O-antigen ligase